jgi:hypothetical protein
MSHPGLTKYMKKNTKYYDQGVTKGLYKINVIDSWVLK